MTKLQPHELLNILLPSDEFELQPLVTYIQETLIKNYDDFIIKNILEIVELIYQKKFLNELWDFSIQEICYINKWNKNDFTVMERQLNRFIPLIRFYYISSEDSLLKIYPFKELLSNDLVNNIFGYHTVPNNKLNINMQPPRSLKCKDILHYDKIGLLYRASRDGNTVAAFHEICINKKGATIVVINIKNSDQIIGGYNPLEWNSSNNNENNEATKDSFIFSFTNKNVLQSAKVGYSNGNQYSIICLSSLGWR
ncbi:hypothetical protein C1645_835790 [Glomus cerebriforme]|uniref:TLDc domain-containing protein n=1 Tax=Glomus cerebriforme TaxID=658196 RepID=A0A397SD25_9GLOM|nr:hypothetical protein C1645_835790 [Glomus cerebriforme]